METCQIDRGLANEGDTGARRERTGGRMESEFDRGNSRHFDALCTKKRTRIVVQKRRLGKEQEAHTEIDCVRVAWAVGST